MNVDKLKAKWKQYGYDSCLDDMEFRITKMTLEECVKESEQYEGHESIDKTCKLSIVFFYLKSNQDQHRDTSW